MKIEELNWENILIAKNNLDIQEEDDISDWMEYCVKERSDFCPTILYENKDVKIYRSAKGEDLFIVTNSNDDVLSWFEVYDLDARYKTKYEWVFSGHGMNCHIDKLNGELHEYPTR